MDYTVGQLVEKCQNSFQKFLIQEKIDTRIRLNNTNSKAEKTRLIKKDNLINQLIKLEFNLDDA
jgi:hypothetical protein